MVVEVEDMLVELVDVLERDGVGDDETAAIESRNIFMFMLPGNPDKRLGLNPERPAVRDEDGNPKLALEVGVEFM